MSYTYHMHEHTGTHQFFYFLFFNLCSLPNPSNLDMYYKVYTIHLYCLIKNLILHRKLNSSCTCNSKLQSTLIEVNDVGVNVGRETSVSGGDRHELSVCSIHPQSNAHRTKVWK